MIYILTKALPHMAENSNISMMHQSQQAVQIKLIGENEHVIFISVWYPQVKINLHSTF